MFPKGAAKKAKKQVEELRSDSTAVLIVSCLRIQDDRTHGATKAPHTTPSPSVLPRRNPPSPPIPQSLVSRASSRVTIESDAVIPLVRDQESRMSEPLYILPVIEEILVLR
jgi:hypothetical protein